MEHFDAIVAGMGGMGSATAYQLARRGLKVLGLEKHNLLHDMGSSHGLTRIIRLPYYEHPAYVPLLFRAYDLWRQLENLTGERILFVTGGIDAGPENGRIVQGSLAACKEHSLRHEVLDAGQLHERFPGVCLSKDMVAVYSPDSGFVLSERTVALYTRLALEHGAEVHAREPVVEWEIRPDSVIVRTEVSTYSASRLIVSAGAWASKLMPSLSKVLQPERQVLIWTRPLRPDIFQLGAFPIFNLQSPEGHFYGFPVYDFPGFKIGRYHHRNEKVDPDAMDRECHPEDEAVLREGILRYFPEANGPALALKVCLFTNTPDEHFILDAHPESNRVFIAAGFSGHGFKFCSVVGEIMAELASSGATRHNLDLFRLNREFKPHPPCASF
ncbi:MAG TPA: N-methyl-L-tryptophan oxidase [Terriglobia bacterium]|nr:N-methyl-L-tryptophan oxidase [Terriglobia bacterium]